MEFTKADTQPLKWMGIAGVIRPIEEWIENQASKQVMSAVLLVDR